MPAPASLSTKKIILVGPAPPYRGGIAHFLSATFNGLKRRGHEVEVVNFTRQYPALFFPGKTQYETAESTTIPSTRLLDSVNPLSWRGTAKYMISKKPDVVLFMHWMPFFAPAYGFIARRLKAKGIRIVCLVHNALPHERRPGDRAMSRYFFKACDGFLSMSAAVNEDLKLLGANGQKLLVGHPVYESFGDAVPQDEARGRLGLSSQAPVLLFFGFVRRYKGLKVLLDSMPAVVKELPDVRLVVAGECYEDEQEYRSFVARNDLATHVVLKLEYIPEQEIADLFSSADVVVQPYISATQSGVAQIAYHFDRSLIVTDVGGLAEIVPHEQAGLVVPPEDPDALAKAIVRFFREGMKLKLQAGVLREKKKYSWDQLLAAIEQLAGA